MSIKEIFSGNIHASGHVQGIVVDEERGFVYFSFTTKLLKTDMHGNLLGSAVNLAGHLGCITFDKERNKIYGSLELKHDVIGRGIINKIGYDPSSEDAFYLVSFDLDKIVRENMDVEREGIMQAVCLNEVIDDYKSDDEVSGKAHRYGCSGIDGTALGRVFGDDSGIKKIMVAYGIYSECDRTDNDNQVILQFDRNIFDIYGKPLNQAQPHKSGPERAEERYFLYTGNTSFGVQNLEYDEYSDSYFVAVYPGKKAEYENFELFVIDGSIAPRSEAVIGRGGERGKTLTLKKAGKQDSKHPEIYGSHFPHGSTGIASMGDGRFYISIPGNDGEAHTSLVKLYSLDMTSEQIFEEI